MAAEKIRQLDVKRPKKETQEEEIPKELPRFVGDIVSAVVDEGESVRFETGVEPRGDPRLKVEWWVKVDIKTLELACNLLLIIIITIFLEFISDLLYCLSLSTTRIIHRMYIYTQ